MDKSYYLEYYHLEREHWWFKIREEIILDKIKLIRQNNYYNQPLEILNIGVATGRSTEALSLFGKVTSIEYDTDCCAFTREKTGLEIIEGSILDLKFDDNKFDVVCAFDVLEHVQDDFVAVNEMYRVCKNNGSILITVPALMSLWSHHDVINHHYRRYTIRQVDLLFNKYSKHVFSRSYFNFFLFPPIYLIRKLSNMLPKLFKRTGTGSDFALVNPNSLSNKIAKNIFRLEKWFLNFLNFPIGVSIIYGMQKPGDELINK